MNKTTFTYNSLKDIQQNIPKIKSLNDWKTVKEDNEITLQKHQIPWKIPKFTIKVAFT